DAGQSRAPARRQRQRPAKLRLAGTATQSQPAQILRTALQRHRRFAPKIRRGGHWSSHAAPPAGLIFSLNIPSVFASPPNIMTQPNYPFLAACRREKTSYTPVWLMRQAGRYMEDYRKLRAQYGFLELCKRPDLAAEITLAPVEKLNVDAAILFADILLL